MKFFYKCTECGREYAIEPNLMVCPQCSKEQKPDEPLRGILQVFLDGNVSLDSEIFDLLPVEKEYFPSIPVGNTPLWKPENLRKKLNFPNLFIKDDTLNPTGSLKDRASYLVASFAKKYGIKNIIVASTGNAASSMAGIGAAAGLSITIFVPKNVPRAKLIQSLQYGAKAVPVDGNYDRAFDLSLEYSARTGGLSRNTAYNPMTIEGKKTVAIEIFKQLGEIPDFVFVPVGDGVILAGVYKGFIDLKQLGFIEHIPTIYAVQSDGSSAICKAFESGHFSEPIESHTIADSICVNIPRNGYFAVKLLRENKGRCVLVSDETILNSQKFLSSSTGLFAEPAGATSLAGFMAVRNEIPADAKIVLLATGNGLKDIDSASVIIDIPNDSIDNIDDIIK